MSKIARETLNPPPGRAENATMRSSSLFQAAAAFAVLVVLVLGYLEGPRLGKELGLLEQDPVLVFMIPDLNARHPIRAAIARDRVLYSDDQGIAVRGNWVLASNHDAASQVIARAGWVEHPIKMMTLVGEPADEDETLSGSAQGATREERLAQLRQLVHKPTLTRGEQIFVLQAMSDGIEL